MIKNIVFCLSVVAMLIIVGNMGSELRGYEKRVGVLEQRNNELVGVVAQRDEDIKILNDKLVSAETTVAVLTEQVEAANESESVAPVKSEPVASTSVNVRTSSGGEVETLIRNVCAEMGVFGISADAMVELAWRESTIGTNPKAYEVGRSCVGLFQLDENKGTFEQRIDDTWSTYKALEYVYQRYGSPEAALAHHNTKGWY